jgi:hypothetical protein
MEQILQKFKMTEEEFIEHKIVTTQKIKKYYLSEIDIIIGKENRIPKHLEYLNNLDLSYDEYSEFGADKCGFDDFIEFCKEINIDFPENITRIKASTEQRYFHFYSKDKKITFTCSSIKDNYLGYFGVTGEASKVLKVFQIFCEMGTWDELCWAKRDFI